jgi:transposase
MTFGAKVSNWAWATEGLKVNTCSVSTMRQTEGLHEGRISWFIVAAGARDETEIRAGLKAPAEQVLKDIRRRTGRQVLGGRKDPHCSGRTARRGEYLRREGSAASMYYGWSKEFLEAGKRRLAGDTARAATSGEVKDLRREAISP